ncbi:SH3 domain-containing protein [Algoriphagus taiwanensis]|uniref:SH3b domain-containing protein n=1 Tax=Algoriphagus taiwanensis TaxID=1445656 RepID=A0ABQ6PX01_9BACT|nr:hypothetical protein Ataiwa_04480 [Algoriphagus taiwanensis]
MKKLILLLFLFLKLSIGISQINTPDKLPDSVACNLTNAPIRPLPDPASEIIGKIPKGAYLKVIDYYEKYLKVRYDTIEGYISYTFVKSYSPEFREYYEYAKAIDEKDLKEIIESKNQERLENLTQRFGKSAAEKIFKKSIWIGMTEEMLLESWGNPIDINRTVLRNLVKKQYVYPNYKYVYLENGKVTAWQD